MRHQLVEDFAVSYYNGSIRPNLAEKNPINGRDIEYLMDGRQFEKTNRPEIWSYSSATGTGYQYKVTYRDKRFSNLDHLLEMYSGKMAATESDQPLVEQRLYELILLLIKEGRLPRNFKIQPASDTRISNLVSMVEQLGQSIADLEKRLRRIEERRTVQGDSGIPNDSRTLS